MPIGTLVDFKKFLLGEYALLFAPVETKSELVDWLNRLLSLLDQAIAHGEEDILSLGVTLAKIVPELYSKWAAQLPHIVLFLVHKDQVILYTKTTILPRITPQK